MATKEIKTSIRINANPNRVWDILTDFKSFPNWNPFLTSVSGEFIVGNNVEITAGGMQFKPIVLVYKELEEIRWLGKLLIKGVFDGEHIFELIDNEDGTTSFNQNEIFSGFLVGLFAKKLDNETKTGFEEMNQKLKALSENVDYKVS